MLKGLRLSLKFPVICGKIFYGGTRLELKAGFPGRLGQRLDPAVEYPAAAVEADFLDAFLYGPFGHERADYLGGLQALARFHLALQFLLQAGGGGEGRALRVVYDLGVEILVAPVHAQAGPGEGVGPEVLPGAVFSVLVSFPFAYHICLP